ncbi:MerR family transcriptional regulator [Pediococcus parvulus]|jgi:DNA-binding transcriptional MerR regulator|uniref:MerR family transcriptional regulator n=1 Tax=Pediococcus parvulus TaxID=54062 RepID=A0A176TL77_9LACO|nr:MerR family transcriptional regulator [Pediococcus parvulus]MDN5574876.1 MerR family transcriptional regulator [Pediococcus sp.]MCT3026542.1 MerR family transcriptional regulator [Pediococcus parvulus]MDV7693772.1 MerR family transcriptional regulator [Pediococcus parvulus]OAD64497.1 MerR family transcriptional regulator [Pediococcus parvulus]GEL89946.1 MerR family transcriptional regulator [Pediococcus parvulus]
MNIKEASEKTGVSSATIRYYEKETLIPAIDRSEAGNREIDERIIRRINFVKQMRAAGMSIENLRRYIQLFDNQEDNTKEQIALLNEQMAEMEEKRDDLQAAIDHLHFKLNHFYDHVQASEEELRTLERQHQEKLDQDK